jgi:tungstate transport system substrate-binding protein
VKSFVFARGMPAPAYPLLASVALIFAIACGGDSDSKAIGDGTAVPHRGDMILATTTSTQDTGLLDVLSPLFEKRTGWTAKPVAVGSGQALTMGRRGDADVLLVHSPDAEEQFVKDGFAKDRVLVMHNDFVLVGPASDQAGVKAASKAVDAMKVIADKGATFISRGDASGTNALELKLWQMAGIDPKGKPWYQESGQGMGATLQIADQKSGYTLSDRGTYLALEKNLKLQVVNQGDPAYLNIYHVMTLNPERNPQVKSEAGKAFADFIVSAEAQKLIAEYGKDKFGQPLFVADAGKRID